VVLKLHTYRSIEQFLPTKRPRFGCIEPTSDNVGKHMRGAGRPAFQRMQKILSQANVQKLRSSLASSPALQASQNFHVPVERRRTAGEVFADLVIPFWN
jgi:hypothetical protein